MHIRATCNACNRDFLFFQLRHGDPWTADRCPHCDRRLGVEGLLAVRAEKALALLVRSLDDLGRHNPNFTVRPTSILGPIENAIAPLAPPPAATSKQARRNRWSNQTGAAA